MQIRNVAMAIAVSGAVACTSKEQLGSASAHADAARNVEAPASPPDPAAVAEKWVRRSDYLVDTRREKPLPRESAAPVARESLDRTVELLDPHEWCVLSREDAEKFAGVPITGPEGGVYVLLRGVESLPDDPKDFLGPDTFKVYFKDGSVRVETNGARFADRDYSPRPVVARLPTEPKELFVDPLYVCVMHSLLGETEDSRDKR